MIEPETINALVEANETLASAQARASTLSHWLGGENLNNINAIREELSHVRALLESILARGR